MPYVVASRASVTPSGAVSVDRQVDDRQQDTAWVEAALGGDDDAFRSLVERYQERAYRIALGVLGSREEARDVAQESFLRVYRSLERFHRGQSFYTWLYRIVVNLSIDALRKRSNDRPIALDDLGETVGVDCPPDAGLRQRELKHRVQAVLDLLPPKYKIVLVLRDIDELACWEIAKVVGCTHATARWRLHKARRMFKDTWERQQRRAGRQPRMGGA